MMPVRPDPDPQAWVMRGGTQLTCTGAVLIPQASVTEVLSVEGEAKETGWLGERTRSR